MFCYNHCVKSVQIPRSFWSVFSVSSPNLEKYGQRKTPYSDTFHEVNMIYSTHTIYPSDAQLNQPFLHSERLHETLLSPQKNFLTELLIFKIFFLILLPDCNTGARSCQIKIQNVVNVFTEEES